MEVVIYRNIKGKFQPKAFKLWNSYMNLLGFTLDEHTTKNTTTITVYLGDRSSTFTIFHSPGESNLSLNYLRLEPADPQIAKLIDQLIQCMNLSGEKHIIKESVRISTFFNEGKVVNMDHSDNRSKFELLLLKETILGFIHLLLDRMNEFQRADNLEKIAEIKGMLSHYQKILTQLNKQISHK